MSVKRGIVGDTAINVCEMLFGVLGGLLFQSLLAWNLGPAGRGEYAVWIAIATLAAVAFTLGTDRAIQIQMVSRGLSLPQATLFGLMTVTVGSIAAISVLYFLSETDFRYSEYLPSRNQFWAYAMIPSIAVLGVLQLLLAGKRHFPFLATTNLVRVALQVTLGAAFFVSFGSTPTAAYMAMVATASAVACILLVFTFKQESLGTLWVSANDVRSMASYALRYFPGRLGSVANAYLAILLLAVFTTKEDVGLFSLAVGLMAQSLILSNALNRAVLPHVGTDKEQDSKLIALCCRTATSLYGLLLVFYLGLLSLFVPYLFSASFENSIPLLWCLLPGVWFQGATRPLRVYFFGSNLPGVVSLSTLLELTVTSLAMTGGYFMLGLKGVALGVSLGQLAGAIVLVIRFHSYSQRSFSETWVWNSADTRYWKQRFGQIVVEKLLRRKSPSLSSSVASDTRGTSEVDVTCKNEATAPHATAVADLEKVA